ncbi:unnamed protein product [Vicia faba]|uniref:Uncharacterized protein n=1 Tax=Vicia faba TaxID=3906 RepID=A0AAV0Z840_VICFA|nr:unnamed protein product [Vicia faba]
MFQPRKERDVSERVSSPTILLDRLEISSTYFEELNCAHYSKDQLDELMDECSVSPSTCDVYSVGIVNVQQIPLRVVKECLDEPQGSILLHGTDLHVYHECMLKRRPETMETYIFCGWYKFAKERKLQFPFRPIFDPFSTTVAAAIIDPFSTTLPTPSPPTPLPRRPIPLRYSPSPPDSAPFLTVAARFALFLAISTAHRRRPIPPDSVAVSTASSLPFQLFPPSSANHSANHSGQIPLRVVKECLDEPQGSILLHGTDLHVYHECMLKRRPETMETYISCGGYKFAKERKLQFPFRPIFDPFSTTVAAAIIDPFSTTLPTPSPPTPLPRRPIPLRYSPSPPDSAPFLTVAARFALFLVVSTAHRRRPIPPDSVAVSTASSSPFQLFPPSSANHSANHSGQIPLRVVKECLDEPQGSILLHGTDLHVYHECMLKRRPETMETYIFCGWYKFAKERKLQFPFRPIFDPFSTTVAAAIIDPFSTTLPTPSPPTPLPRRPIPLRYSPSPPDSAPFLTVAARFALFLAVSTAHRRRPIPPDSVAVSTASSLPFQLFPPSSANHSANHSGQIPLRVVKECLDEPQGSILLHGTDLHVYHECMLKRRPETMETYISCGGYKFAKERKLQFPFRPIFDPFSTTVAAAIIDPFSTTLPTPSPPTPLPRRPIPLRYSPSPPDSAPFLTVAARFALFLVVSTAHRRRPIPPDSVAVSTASSSPFQLFPPSSANHSANHSGQIPLRVVKECLDEPQGSILLHGTDLHVYHECMLKRRPETMETYISCGGYKFAKERKLQFPFRPIFDPFSTTVAAAIIDPFSTTLPTPSPPTPLPRRPIPLRSSPSPPDSAPFLTVAARFALFLVVSTAHRRRPIPPDSVAVSTASSLPFQLFPPSSANHSANHSGQIPLRVVKECLDEPQGSILLHGTDLHVYHECMLKRRPETMETYISCGWYKFAKERKLQFPFRPIFDPFSTTVAAAIIDPFSTTLPTPSPPTPLPRRPIPLRSSPSPPDSAPFLTVAARFALFLAVSTAHRRRPIPPDSVAVSTASSSPFQLFPPSSANHSGQIPLRVVKECLDEPQGSILLHGTDLHVYHECMLKRRPETMETYISCGWYKFAKERKLQFPFRPIFDPFSTTVAAAIIDPFSTTLPTPSPPTPLPRRPIPLRSSPSPPDSAPFLTFAARFALFLAISTAHRRRPIPPDSVAVSTASSSPFQLFPPSSANHSANHSGQIPLRVVKECLDEPQGSILLHGTDLHVYHECMLKRRPETMETYISCGWYKFAKERKLQKIYRRRPIPLRSSPSPPDSALFLTVAARFALFLAISTAHRRRPIPPDSVAVSTASSSPFQLFPPSSANHSGHNLQSRNLREVAQSRTHRSSDLPPCEHSYGS